MAENRRKAARTDAGRWRFLQVAGLLTLDLAFSARAQARTSDQTVAPRAVRPKTGLSNSAACHPSVAIGRKRGESWRAEAAKGRSKLADSAGMPGAGLTVRSTEKARSDRLTLKPYCGNPTY
jgi:hypothetical protein